MTVACAAGVAIYRSDGFIDRPVNRNDAARLVDYYERLHNTGLSDAYRFDCDFMDWHSEHSKDTIDPSCTLPGSAHTVLLWGDSFAQALSLGLREAAPPGTSIAQVATSACLPMIEDFDLSVKERRCEKTNLYAMDAIKRLKPDLVIIAESGGHTISNWPSITARILELGAKQILVVGPFPIWRPSLPRVYAEHHMIDHAEYVGTGLDIDSFTNDKTVAAKINGLANVTYLSLLDQLCREASRSSAVGAEADRYACLARVPGEGELDLMAVDFGHLTPKGSSYLGRAIWKPYLDRAIGSH